jgi:MarR family transcriptional regulator, organic hydroperoxide resistance regulator
LIKCSACRTIFLYLRNRLKREETIDYHIKAAWHAIARMYNQQAMKYDGTMSIGYALLNISSEEGVAATKVGPLMGLEPRSLTRLLKSMEEKGLIYREVDKNDKRSVRVLLTKEGRKMKEKSRETVLRFNEAVRDEVSTQKLNTFFEVVQCINQVVEKNGIYEKVLQ